MHSACMQKRRWPWRHVTEVQCTALACRREGGHGDVSQRCNAQRLHAEEKVAMETCDRGAMHSACMQKRRWPWRHVTEVQCTALACRREGGHGDMSQRCNAQRLHAEEKVAMETFHRDAMHSACMQKRRWPWRHVTEMHCTAIACGREDLPGRHAGCKDAQCSMEQ